MFPTSSDPSALPPDNFQPQMMAEEPEQQYAKDFKSIPFPQGSNLMAVLDPMEIEHIRGQIRMDLQNSYADHSERMERFTRYWSRFRKLQEPTEPDDVDGSHITVPVILWSVLGEYAQIFFGLFGDDSQVIAAPKGPADEKTSKTVSKFMDAVIYDLVDLPTNCPQQLLYMLLFGRAIAYRPWEVSKRLIVDEQGNMIEVEGKKGPAWVPVWPGDWFEPGERVTDLQKLSWCGYRRYLRVNDLLRMEQDGDISGIEESIEEYMNQAGRDVQASAYPDPMRAVREEAEGVKPTYRNDARGLIEVIEYYGKWNLPNEIGDSVSATDWKNRDPRAIDIVAYYIPRLEKVIGVHSLAHIYRRMENRRPFDEKAINESMGRWPAGMGELLYDIEMDSTSNHQQMTEAIRLSSLGHGMHEAGAGLDEKFEIKPGTSQAVKDASKIKWHQIPYSSEGHILKEHALQAITERVLGRSDQTLGRGSDRPNAPRTATGQTLLMEAANLRISVDIMSLSNQFKRTFKDIWQMYQDCCDITDMVFRVTEEEIPEGFEDQTQREFEMDFDFELKFAPTQLRKEAIKQQKLSLYQLMLQNPLIMTNPVALWKVTNDLYQSFGVDNFAEMVPEPPDPGLPKDPKREWSMMQQGEEVPVNPLDNDQLHLNEHMKQYQAAISKGNPDDADAVWRLEQHIVDTQDAIKAKMLMQAAMANASQQVGNAIAGPQPMQPGAGMGQEQPMQQGGMNAPIA